MCRAVPLFQIYREAPHLRSAKAVVSSILLNNRRSLTERSVAGKGADTDAPGLGYREDR